MTIFEPTPKREKIKKVSLFSESAHIYNLKKDKNIMLIENFTQNCSKYSEFSILNIENMDAFLNINGVIQEIFEKDFQMKLEEFKTKRSEIEKTDMKIMEQVLDQIGDKHFYIFTFHSQNHLELIQMQENKIMNFGIDIQNIKNDHVFILMCDKK